MRLVDNLLQQKQSITMRCAYVQLHLNTNDFVPVPPANPTPLTSGMAPLGAMPDQKVVYYRSFIRIVDWQSTNARAVLKSLVQALVGKCTYYALSQADVAANVRGVMRAKDTLNRGGYP